jgi:hypothetical protein
MATFNINETARRAQYISTGQAGPYAFNFQVNAASELLVYKNDTLQTDSVQYSATIGVNGDGSITFIDNSGSGGTNYTPANGDRITIIGDQPLARTTVFQVGQANNPVTLETEFDNVVIRQQQLKEITDRSIQLKPSTPRTITGSGTSGPIYWPYDATPANNALKVIAYDSAGTSLELGPTTANLTTLAAIASDISLVAGQISPTNNISILAAISSDLTTLAGIAGLSTLAGITTEIAGVYAIRTEVVGVYNNSTNINIVAGIDSEITTVAGIDTEIVNVNNNQANINLVAGQISPTNNISTLAGLDTEISALYNIRTDISQVSSDSADVQTVAADLSGADNIGTVATNIVDVNTFANRYRIGSSLPSTSLDQGDLFFNTSDSTLYVWTGSTWAAIEVDTDIKTSVSANDTTPGFLNGKLVAGTNISLTENNDGGNETLTIDNTGASAGFALAMAVAL